MQTSRILVLGALLAVNPVHAQESILFIGNSFTFGGGSAVQFFHPDSVTDLNQQGIGGVPALFKAFTVQAGLEFDVSLETEPGSGLEFHLANKLDLIRSQAWDTVLMHGQSTLDFAAPGDPAKLIATTQQLTELLVADNPSIDIYLTATWSRADQVYPAAGAWAGKSIEEMAIDLRGAYNAAAQTSPAIKAVIPVGEAWNRAMQTGVADANPYDGISFDQLNLWTHDHYHASSAGYYLEALVVFGAVTGRDPRSLGNHECAGYELGLSQRQIQVLQQTAFDELAAAGRVTAAPLVSDPPLRSARCMQTN